MIMNNKQAEGWEPSACLSVSWPDKQDSSLQIN
jgi:hypothetical protein